MRQNHHRGPTAAMRQRKVITCLFSSIGYLLEDADVNCSVFEAHHLVAKNGQVQYFTETHRMRLLTREHLTQLFREAGWDAEYIEGGPAGRGLYVGR
jgi:hypothetical protein